jgi:hypothetical protein
MPGADELAFSLAAVAARLREIGEGGLARELQKAIGDAVAPVGGEIRRGLRPHLPDRYADVLDADLKISRSSSLSGEEARVTMLASASGTKKRKLRPLDEGVLRHPVFGNRKVTWPAQAVEPGFFSGPVEDAVPQVRAAVEAALDVITEKAVNG